MKEGQVGGVEAEGGTSLALQLLTNLFQSPFFSAASHPYIFRKPLAEKMHSLFSASQLYENPFPVFLFITIFHLSLINVPIIHVEGF